ncbi:GNAT family N-acetyltransferase [Comamonas serinivorans]|uniref:GNAT family N-acetyltransferase n=1 Tax=Comamonas serinivorans TaxID=1082851 RepID=A0A1Y0ETB2_9BURK|nr:bifunctional acetate--CoA ligase family protein/GNAT family N-acetyltransferase [Comamonas serinivorans]ARU06539.1 GNAT family N-acetyltransferase [Comamonas serinivorans]
MDKHYLTPLFNPRSIVVFAGPGPASATGGEPATTPDGERLCAMLQASPFDGHVQYLDIAHTAGSLADLARSRADLAIIALPFDEALSALEIAGRIECQAALVLSSDMDATQAAQLREVALRHEMYLLGPNTRGFQRPQQGLNACVVGDMAQSGPLALVSQSGSLTSSILDWSGNNGVGFSSVVSLGPHTLLDVADVLDFLASDRDTHSIVLYLEGITNARRFMSALRAAAHAKPVVVLKAGRKEAGNRVALTHSATIVGSDDVFDAALRRAGAVRVQSFVQLFSAAKCLASRYRPTGKRLGLISNGGGPGVLAADWVSELGLQLGVLSESAQAELLPQLPPKADLSGLVDLSEDAQAEHYKLALTQALADRQLDGVLVICAPKPGQDAKAMAQAVADCKPLVHKPLIVCWMGDASVGESREVLARARIPSFRTPEAAVGAFGNIASYYQNQLLLQQTPPPLTEMAKPDVEGARLLIEGVLSERRTLLTEMESKALLSAFHIPVTQTVLTRSPNEAMMMATQLGFPVALKVDSPDIAHKSDVGGVVLNLASATAVRDAYEAIMQAVQRNRPDAHLNGITVQAMARKRRGRELYIGLVSEPPFGPVIAFGAGGVMIELMDDRAMELPPLNQYLARRLIERSRVSSTLGEWRGSEAVDQTAIEHVLLRVSEMVCELPQLREMDINPLIADEQGVVAVDARIVVSNAAVSSRPYNHLAILPYPAQFEQRLPLRGGGEYTIRPVHPDDAQMLQELTRGLSSESRYFRFASAMSELPPSMLSRFTLIDYDREMALVAVVRERQADDTGAILERERIIGVSRYITNPDRTSCEFSLLVADDYAGRGLGSRLMLSITDAAREKGLAEIIGLVLTNNHTMLKLMRSLGFDVKPYPGDPDFRLVTKRL